MKTHSKSQSAMEYLMTYGWAILIIAVVLGALFQLGVFNSSSFSPRAPPGACQVFRPSGPGTTTNINLMGVCTGQLPQYVAQFGGSSGSYTNIPYSTALDNFGTMAISAWIYPTSVVDGQSHAVVNKGWQATGSFLVFISSGGVLYFSIRDSAQRSAFWGTPLSTNQWYHVVATYQKGSPSKIYVNGVAGSDSSTTDNSPLSLISPVQISSASSFNGLISNVQVYNASLSANQVQALYLEGIGGAPMKLQNLIGWWPLNGDTKDYSGNNNNCVPTGVTFTSQYGK